MKIEILYATETCRSEMLSYDLEEAAKAYFDCTVRDMDEVRPVPLN
ncbi:MAG: hypothetical protein AAF724_05380 [Pseudomonadota bacterium]